MLISYKIIRLGVVEIQEDEGTNCLDLYNIQIAIENLKYERNAYATEKAYKKQLSILEGALLSLQKND